MLPAQQNPWLLAQANTQANGLRDIYARAGIMQSAFSPYLQSPTQSSMIGLGQQIAQNPVSIDDATKSRMVGAESDQAVHGYGQSRQLLRDALARAGALDSPVGAAKEVQLSNQLGANLQGIQRGGEVTQATTNLQDRISSLGVLSGLQRALTKPQGYQQPAQRGPALVSTYIRHNIPFG